jgi:hypothetical protein
MHQRSQEQEYPETLCGHDEPPEINMVERSEACLPFITQNGGDKNEYVRVTADNEGSPQAISIFFLL